MLIAAIIGIAMFFAPLLTSGQSTAGIDVESQDIESEIVLSLTLDREDWTYRLNEEVVFEISISSNHKGYPVGEVHYTIGPEKMEPQVRGSLRIDDGVGTIRAAGMAEPGFLRGRVSLEINGKIYNAVATAAFEPEEINPTVEMPNDFNSYWNLAIKQSKQVPLNMDMVPIASRSTDAVDVYQVAYQFYNDTVQTAYGVLSVPKKIGKYPAIIRFPGAGWAPLSGDQGNAAKGFITLDLYIHGRPVTKNKAYYDALKVNELKDYMYKGISDRDSFYFKNVILGCVRAVDLIYSLKHFDGTSIGAWGSSQGGALSIITTSLEPRINYFVALCPAMSDFTGYLNGRAGGWPHFFTKPELYENNQEQVLNTLAYYDVVNFSRNIQAPGYFSWGFNDETTPPTSFYSAYNQVRSQKNIFVIPDGAHRIYPEQREKTYRWLRERLLENEKTPTQ